MGTITNLSDLSPAMRTALLEEHASVHTGRALQRRGLASLGATRNGHYALHLTEAGRRAAGSLRSELDASPIVTRCPNPWHDSAPARARDKQLCPECPGYRAESYDPYWVRCLVETVGRELHDMDMLARSTGDRESGFARGQAAAWEAAAGYLSRAVRQSVDRLGLTDVLEGSRAGKGCAELASYPQRIVEG